MAVSELPAADEPLHIAVPQSPCRSAVDHIGWADTLSVEAGRYVLGVRSNSPAAVSLLRDVLGKRVVGGADIDPNLSVYLAPPAEDGENQELHRLYLGHHRVLRSRDPGRVIAGLGGYLDAHARVFDGERPLVLAAAVIGDGRAHLLPHVQRRGIVDRERRWRDHGFQLVDLPWVEVDLGTTEVVVPPSPLAVGEEQWETAGGAVALSTERDAPVEPGRYPLATWSQRRTDGSAGGRLVAVASSLVNLPDLDAGAVLPAIRDVLASVPEVVGATDPDALRGQLSTA